MAHSEEQISSLQNPKVRNTLRLHKPRERKKQGLFLVEGKREAARLLLAGYEVQKVFICQEILEAYEDGAEPRSNQADLPDDFSLNIFMDLLVKQSGQPEIDYVTRQVYAHMAYRKDSEGIICWAVPGKLSLDRITLSHDPLVLVIDAVEKPGNLGAILRTVDAAGIDALIISDPRTDIYNPNVVRSSLGALFTLQIGIGSIEEVIGWLKDNKLNIFCTALTASVPYTEVDFRRPSAIVMGTESAGLSREWLGQSDQNIIIPMHGTVDSMNVSVSAGIVLFEAIRQRKI